MYMKGLVSPLKVKERTVELSHKIPSDGLVKWRKCNDDIQRRSGCCRCEEDTNNK